jgi:hypothetical protein
MYDGTPSRHLGLHGLVSNGFPTGDNPHVLPKPVMMEFDRILAKAEALVCRASHADRVGYKRDLGITRAVYFIPFGTASRTPSALRRERGRERCADRPQWRQSRCAWLRLEGHGSSIRISDPCRRC